MDVNEYWILSKRFDPDLLNWGRLALPWVQIKQDDEKMAKNVVNKVTQLYDQLRVKNLLEKIP
jgi:hypothetical protein